MTERRLIRRWYPLLMVGLMVANIVLTAVLATALTRRTIDADRRAQLAAVQANLGKLCDVIVKQEKKLRDDGTQAGQDAAEAWHDLGMLYRCYKE
jgi:hypothetical protein